MKKSIGATFGTSHPQASQCVLTDRTVGLFDFVVADGILCQVSDIEVRSELTVEDAIRIVNGRKKKNTMSVVAMLDVIGDEDGMKRVNHPIRPGSRLHKAGTDVINRYMGFNQSIDVRLGTMLRRSDVDVRLTRQIFNTHVAILGMTNQGKSNLGKILLEQLKGYQTKVIVIDPHGEYPGSTINMDNIVIDPDCISDEELTRELINKVPTRLSKILQECLTIANYGTQKEKSLTQTLMKITKSGFYQSDKYIGLREYLIKILKAQTLWDTLQVSIGNVQAGKPVVINLKGVDKQTSQQIVSIIAEKVLEMGKSGDGCFMMIDEAHRFLPQRGTPISKAPLIDLIQEGRKFGCGVVIMSQRPANIDKDALSQCNTTVCMKIVNANDVRQVRESTENSSTQMFKEVQRLDKGEALLTSAYIQRPVFVKIDHWQGKP
jgi:hypothetical protein